MKTFLSNLLAYVKGRRTVIRKGTLFIIRKFWCTGGVNFFLVSWLSVHCYQIHRRMGSTDIIKFSVHDLSQLGIQWKRAPQKKRNIRHLFTHWKTSMRKYFLPGNLVSFHSYKAIRINCVYLLLKAVIRQSLCDYLQQEKVMISSETSWWTSLRRRSEKLRGGNQAWYHFQVAMRCLCTWGEYHFASLLYLVWLLVGSAAFSRKIAAC